MRTPTRSQETALHFKRVVEAAVLAAHPEWADTQVGEDLQAFSDFLFYVLNGSNALLSELAIAVFDATSGGVEIYRGLHYPDPAAEMHPAAAETPAGGARAAAAGAAAAPPPAAAETLRANLLCIKYLPGHYQALVGRRDAAARDAPTLVELLRCLDLRGVRYVITDGAA